MQKNQEWDNHQWSERKESQEGSNKRQKYLEDQVGTFHDFEKMLEIVKDLYDKHIVLSSNFNFLFDTSLD